MAHVPPVAAVTGIRVERGCPGQDSTGGGGGAQRGKVPSLDALGPEPWSHGGWREGSQAPPARNVPNC